MAKPDDTRGGRRDWAPLPTSEFQASAFVAVGDDMPKEPFVPDDSRPGPGEQPGKRNRNQTKSRSSKGGET